jgi:hypothetical protein
MHEKEIVSYKNSDEETKYRTILIYLPSHSIIEFYVWMGKLKNHASSVGDGFHVAYKVIKTFSHLTSNYNIFITKYNTLLYLTPCEKSHTL